MVLIEAAVVSSAHVMRHAAESSVHATKPASKPSVESGVVASAAGHDDLVDHVLGLEILMMDHLLLHQGVVIAPAIAVTDVRIGKGVRRSPVVVPGEIQSCRRGMADRRSGVVRRQRMRGSARVKQAARSTGMRWKRRRHTWTG